MKKLLIFLSLFAIADSFDEKDYKKAYPQLKALCIKADANSCGKLALMNEKGLGTKPSYDYAYKYYKNSCELGSLDSCAEAARLEHLGLGTAKNISKARMTLKSLCDKDIYLACDYFAYLEKKEKNTFARDELIKACKAGIANSCAELGDHANNSNGYDLYLRACALGDELSCQKSAKIFISSSQIGEKLLNFSKQSIKECNEENLKACTSLAYIYKELNDIAKARQLYEFACDKNDANSCANLALIEEQNQEFQSGNSHFEKACELKDAFSCARLANIYKEAQNGVKKSLSKAKKYAKNACELGFSKSCE